MRISADTVIATLLLIASVILFQETFAFRTTPLAIIPSSIWPRIVLVLLFIFSLAYLVQSLRNTRDNAEASRDNERLGLTGWVSANRNVVWCFGLFAAFLVTLPWLGMLLGGALFVFSVLTAMGENSWRSHVVNALTAVCAMGFMWALFTFGLGVMLPQGQLLRIF